MPRTLDIDILAIGGLIINNPTLNIPHPLLSERKFVLKPWSDIAPNFIVVNLNMSIDKLLNATTDKSKLSIILDNEGLI